MPCTLTSSFQLNTSFNIRPSSTFCLVKLYIRINGSATTAFTASMTIEHAVAIELGFLTVFGKNGAIPVPLSLQVVYFSISPCMISHSLDCIPYTWTFLFFLYLPPVKTKAALGFFFFFSSSFFSCQFIQIRISDLKPKHLFVK